jgi:hypothetical protein
MVAAQPGQLTYDDKAHAYRLAAARCVNASSLTKITSDVYNLTRWNEEQIAVGFARKPELLEQVALGNRDAIAAGVEEAKAAAGADRKAKRGTQMHFVFERVLGGREDLLITAQQRSDAAALKRTMDLYRLTPTPWVENIILYPVELVAGRFDAIIEKADGTLILVDLKSGDNAVKYPQNTAVQLATYQNAPWMAESVMTTGNRSVVTEWTTLPERLYRDRAYVMLLPPGEKVGTLHSINTVSGWQAAQLALRIVQWRREFGYGRQLARKVKLPADSG